jgi:hypothetical protein
MVCDLVRVADGSTALSNPDPQRARQSASRTAVEIIAQFRKCEERWCLQEAQEI